MTNQKDTFCPAPWMTFYVEPNGRVDLCCIASAQVGNLHERPLKDILRSDKIIEIKKQMLANEPVPGCEACHSGYESSFQHRLVRQFGGREHGDYQSLDDFKLKYLDLRWNNTCNYACIYCSADLSSLWAQIDGVKQIKITNMRTDMMDLVMENLENLQEVYLAGGEPLMLKENLTILTRLAEVNPDCKIICNTNLSNIKENAIFDKINDFKHVQWMVSAEAQHLEYEYIRWPGKWQTFDQNLRTLKSLGRPNHTLAFNLVWLNLNGLSIWDYIDHLINIELDISSVSILPYNMDVWNGPWHLKHMPQEFLQRVRERMSDAKYHKIYTYQQNLDFINKHINDPNHQSNIATIKEYLEQLDKSRNLDHRYIFPTVDSYLQS